MSDTKSQTTKDARRVRYREVQRLWREASAAVVRHREAMDEAIARYRALSDELLPLEDEFRAEDCSDAA